MPRKFSPQKNFTRSEIGAMFPNEMYGIDELVKMSVFAHKHSVKKEIKNARLLHARVGVVYVFTRLNLIDYFLKYRQHSLTVLCHFPLTVENSAKLDFIIDNVKKADNPTFTLSDLFNNIIEIIHTKVQCGVYSLNSEAMFNPRNRE